MNADDAKRVLLKMAATWPQRTMTKAEEGEWQDVLRPISYRAAIEAIEGLREVHEWLPRHNQFLAAAQAAARRIALETPALPEMTGPLLDRETSLERVRAMRAKLRRDG